MNDEFHRQVMETLADALEWQDPGEREAFLSEACESNPELRRQVDSLLEAREAAGDFLGRSVFGDWVGPWEEEPGTLVGPYRLIEELGRGGFGVVFSAEQQHPVRRLVALKIIKLGMDTKEVIARFEAERQALALLDHPNIAHVYDAGVTERGRPYFSMELVTGEPITRYCEHHRLSIKQRLELFLQVCNGVQHAHQRGLIHRDLKPSNIVVTELDGHPLPKIIDFGIVKSTRMRLSQQTLVTRYDFLVGTPAYMSPEQLALSPAAGGDVDTRSDIYSLGVLLYELLAGSPPLEEETLRKATLDEVRQMIREQDPPRPSTRLWTAGRNSGELTKRRGTGLKEDCDALRNDLDWIVIKAIDKDPNRRYATVQDFSADLHRHLKDEPVSARPPSLAYGARKFMRRHQTGVLAGTAVCVALAVGLVLAGLGIARGERRRAEAEAMVRLLRQVLGADSTYQSFGHEFSLEDVLNRLSSLDLDERFRGRPELEGEVHDILARAYNGLNKPEAAREHHAKALELRRQAYGRHPKVADSLKELAWQIQGPVKSAEDTAAAEALVDDAIEIYRTSGGNPLALGHALASRSWFRISQRKLEPAERDLHEVWELIEMHGTRGPGDWAVLLGAFWDCTGTIADMRGDVEEAERCYRLSVQHRRHSENKLQIAHGLQNLGKLFLETRRYPEAESVIREERDLWKWARGEDSDEYKDAAARLEVALRAQGKVAQEEPQPVPER